MNLIISDTDIKIDNNIMISENIKYFDLNKFNIKSCLGCYSCWVRTPSVCIIKDDAQLIYPNVAHSENLIYVTKIAYGTYDTTLKIFLERCLPTQQPFIREYNGETHHVQRDVKMKNAIIIAYGAKNDKEKEIFKKLVNRNAHNMMFETVDVIFTEFENISRNVNEECMKWKNC